ncbi:uncharacterized protein LOC125032715 [Penaeus chinensis]|uniref:uncharacterized protein LOC125032715 n=1 Tax=Penaeus chinensis TaxID=139456 RepID=UPI001FB6A1F0|nr:uncharacterized protein LOC125032715 [Penaeus chinensis]
MEKRGDFIPMDDVMAGMASDYGEDIFLDRNMTSLSFDDTNSFLLAEEVSRIGSTQYNMGQRNRMLQSMAMSPSQNRPMDQVGHGQRAWSAQIQTGQSDNSRRQPDLSLTQPHAAPSLMGFACDGGSGRHMHPMPPLYPEFMPEQREQAPDRARRPKSGRKKRQQQASE